MKYFLIGTDEKNRNPYNINIIIIIMFKAYSEDYELDLPKNTNVLY